MIFDPYYPSVLTLRQKLEKILAPYLGNYGDNTLAIWVEPPSTPKLPVTGGLECIIKRYQNTLSTELLLNSQAADTIEWMISLKSNERTPEIYTKFDQAIRTICLEFPYRRESINDFSEAGTLLAVFRIPETLIINTNLYNYSFYTPANFVSNPPPPVNQAPTITLLAPTTGIINQAITLTANASDSDGAISQVDFYINDVLSNTDTSVPYSYIWTPTSVGNYTLKAIATDNQNVATVSNIITFSATSDIVVVEPPSDDSATPNPIAQNFMGINIPACVDYNAPAFRDAIKQARAFQKADSSGNPAIVDSSGWPKEDASIYFWARPFDMHGTYFCSYQGQNTLPPGGGTISGFGGAISNQIYNSATNTTSFTLTVTDTGQSVVNLTFSNTNGGIKNLKAFRPIAPGSSTSYDSSKIFTDQFVAAINLFQGVRTLDWTGVNSSPMVNVSDRTLPSDWSQNQTPSNYFNFAGKGCCWELTIALMNECYAASPNTFKKWWYNMPVLASDAFITAFFTTVRDGANGYPGLNPNIQLIVEFGNENWNFSPAFQHAGFNADEADREIAAGDTQLAFEGASGAVAGWHRQARRSVQISRIARTVFGDAAMGTRIFIALQWQQGNGQDTAGTMTRFLEERYYPDENLGHDMSYDFHMLGGSAYYSPDNNDPLLSLDPASAHSIWSSQVMDANTWKMASLMTEANYIAAHSAPTGILPMCSYEGGVSFDEATDSGLTQVQKDNLAAVKTAANSNSLITTSIQNHHDVRSSCGGSDVFYYQLGGNGVDDYPWAFTPDIKILNTKKLQGIINLKSSTRAALTLNPRISTANPILLINGLNYNLNNAGYSKDNVEQNDMRSYTFRVHNNGNYRFSISTDLAGTFKFYLGCKIIATSISTPGSNNFSETIIQTLSPGIYAFRYRLMSNSSLTVNQVKIEKI